MGNLLTSTPSGLVSQERDWQPYEALYLHIPFCQKRCNYCDFHTSAIAPDSPEIEAYITKLIMQIRAASRADLLGNLKTMYIGGGTPSFVGNRQLSRLVYALSLFTHLTTEVECTLEANPESFTEPMMKDLFALGVNRLSFGVQSFDNNLLQLLGRVHTGEKAQEAIKMAQSRFENISIDLMCGLPGQTIEQFEADLATALELGIQHISIYPLIIEAGTPFADWVREGRISEEACEDSAPEMMKIASDVLTRAGMARYEVASYAYPGFESRHNRAYWTGLSYLGLGDGAVSMRQDHDVRVRFSGDEEQDRLTRRQYLVEDLYLGMRQSCGVPYMQIKQTGEEVPGVEECFNHLITQGYARKTNFGIAPTERGWLFGNQMYAQILSLEDEC